MLSKQSLKEILELVSESEGSFVILEKDQPRLAVLDFHNYEQLVNRAQAQPAAVGQTQREAQAAQKILLTGGSGRFGSLVAAKLIENNYEVVIFDKASSALDQVEFVQGDLCNLEEVEAVFAEHRFDAVVHLAQVSAPGLNTEDYFINNVEGGLNLLKCMAKYDVKDIVYYSSVLSSSVYCRTKTLFEKILNFYKHGFGINSFSLRMPCLSKSVVAPDADINTLLWEDPVQAVLLTAKGKYGALPIPNVGDLTPDGSPAVEFVADGDAARAILFALRHLKQNNGSFVYKVDGVKTTVKNLVEETLEKANRMVPITSVAAAPNWTEVVQDTTHLLSELGWKPVVTDISRAMDNYWQGEQPRQLPEQQPEQQQVSEPISLSDLLSGKYTPFIKSHQS